MPEGNLVISNASIVVKGDRLIFDINEKRGFIYKPHGILDKLVYRGELGKLNSENHLTLKNIRGTYETNEKPTFSFRAGTFETYGDGRYILENISFNVHNQPFYYFPFLHGRPLWHRDSHSLWGDRERGFFMESSFSPNLPKINRLDVDLNIYEKVGGYLRLGNANNYPFTTILFLWPWLGI